MQVLAEPSADRRERRRGPAPARRTLKNGADVTIRPIQRDDLALEIAFVRALSPESGYQRLLSPRRLSYSELVRLTDIDPARELALIATTRTGRETQVGVARCVIEGDGRRADFAIVVADEWQGLGLGEQLLRSLIDAAADAGVRELAGITQSTNARLIGLVRKLGFETHREPGDATVTGLTRKLGFPGLA